MKWLAPLLSAILIASSAVAATEQQTLTQLVQRIRSQLPKGWIASYDGEYSWLEITRNESVLLLPSIPNRSLADQPKQGTFTIAFRVVPHVTPSDYRRLAKENGRLRKEANALDEELRKRLRSSKGFFDPSTDAEKQEVERYEKMKQAIRILPDYYFRDVSLRWEYPPWSRHPYSDVVDKAIRKECEQTQGRILKLLSTYEAGEPSVP